MPNAQDKLEGFNTDLLRRNYFCKGKKKGNEYVCDGEADNSGVVDNAVDLLAETLRRLLRWRVWNMWWIEEWMDEWLIARDNLEIRLRSKYSKEVVNDLLRLVNEFIEYNERFREYWQDKGNEVKKLVNNLIHGDAEVIIWENEKGISVHYEHITLNAHRTKTSVVVQLTFKGLKGMTINVPNVFRKTMGKREYVKFVNEMYKALKGGLEKTDGFTDKSKASMVTAQIWQVIVWSLLYPGKTSILTAAVDVNKESVAIQWRMRASHESVKGSSLNDADKLNMEGLLAFMFAAVLGDGSADITKSIINGYAYDVPVITITMKDFDVWRPILNKLWDMGFKWNKSNTNGTTNVRFVSSNAINLARAMISVLPPILRDVLDALGFEKWLRIRRIAEMEVKWRRGEMSVDIAGFKFTVVIHEGTVELVRPVITEVEKVINVLRAVYGDEFVKYVRINKSGKRLAVKIPMYVFERYDDIKAQVIEVLRRKLEKAKDEKKKQIITKHLMKLASTEGNICQI